MGEPINPESLPEPRGFSYAFSAEGSRIIHFAGHTSLDGEGQIVGPSDMVVQFDQVLMNLSLTAREASVELADIVKMTLFVTDAEAYKSKASEIGKIYRRHFGEHYPAMTLVEISRLWDPAAMIEIEAVGVVD
ncbi:MAG: RidA family protein [Anaerolineales bacterium]